MRGRSWVVAGAACAVLVPASPATAGPPDVTFDVAAWNVPVPPSRRVDAAGFQVTARSADGAYGVCSVTSARATGDVVTQVGISCAADRDTTLTVSLGSGAQTATQALAYTLPPPAGRARDHELFRYAGRVMRFQPCRRIPVRFNPGPRSDRPAFALRGFRYAVEQVRRASGIPLVYKGTTSFVPRTDRRTTGRGISVAYVRAGRKAGRSDFPELRARQVLGIGGWRTDRTGRWLDAGYAVIKRSPATADERTYVLTVMHEIGHAVGLDHASPRGRQVMAPSETAPGIVWGSGDLRGLQKVGPRRAC